jgi:hypothetical protein
LPGTANRKAALFSIGLYLAALAFHGLAARESNIFGFEGYRGFMCLLFGWMTALGGWKFFLPWTANLFYVAGLLLLALPARPARVGLLLPATGLVIALYTFRIESVMVNEAGHRVDVHPGAGAYLWMASFVVLVAGFLMPQRARA